MKKRFVVCINDSDKEKDKDFIEFIKNNNLGWWHWLSHTWFLSDSNGKLSAAEIRTKVKNIYNENNIVIELNENGDTWSGYGPKGKSRNMFDWLKRNWGN